MSNELVSIVIPSRNEKYLKATIDDLLSKAKGPIEVIAVLDGYWPEKGSYNHHEKVHYLHFPQARGMREAINSGVSLARGQYILKTDAHCSFDEGYDEKLKADCESDWVVVPRRYSLDVETWERKEKPPVDYMYLAHPDDKQVWGGRGLQGKEWRELNARTGEFPEIDDLMTFQGSAWFMKRDYFFTLELMDEKNYGEFGKEAQEIGLKCWLSGGRVVVNKKTYYAHWHKPKEVGRGYSLSNEEFEKASAYTLNWLEDKGWAGQRMTFHWLIDYFTTKFGPIPGWEGYYAQ